MIDWLDEDHLVWFVIEAVKRLDTAAFHRLARLGGVGRRGYDPDMVLTLFVYAMAYGVSSSRQIERLCHTDVAFRVICAQDVPDHTVLARFRQNHQDALTGLLTESLVLAAELGMVSLGTVALDGTKIAGNASKDANRSERYLRKLAEQYLDEVAAADEAEDTAFGEDNRGDELPPGVGDRTGRRQRIGQALEQITKRREEAENARREQAERTRVYQQTAQHAAVPGHTAPAGRPPADVDRVVVARARWQRARAKAADRYQQWQQARARGESPGGRPAVPPDEHNKVCKAWAAYQTETAAAAAAARNPTTDTDTAAGAGDSPERFTANLTDPDSRLLKTRNGWLQGYNCQTATSDDEFIVSARATQDANDLEQFIPTIDDVTATAHTLADRASRDDLRQIGTVLADAGYDSDTNLTADGPDRLIADGKRRTIDQRALTDPTAGDPPENASPREQMTHRLRTPEGHTLYKRRAPMIEAPNAWLKDRRGLRRFTRRGLAAVHAELSFASAVTNLLKIATKGITTTQLRAS